MRKLTKSIAKSQALSVLPFLKKQKSLVNVKSFRQKLPSAWQWTLPLGFEYDMVIEWCLPRQLDRLSWTNCLTMVFAWSDLWATSYGVMLK
jgi:hypothetical protein